MRFVLLKKFCEDSGYTVKAIECKIAAGAWMEGFQYVKAPDGRIHVDMEGYERWVAGLGATSKSGKRASGSSSTGRAAA